MNSFGVAFTSGMSLGFSLIIVIGAQNAFVLKQGLRNQHIFLVCLICAISDALLIVLGVSGFAVVTAKFSWLEAVARYAGAGFLLAYGARSFYKAWKSSAYLHVDASGGVAGRGNLTAASRRLTMLTCVALTWLNPHVYLDTVVLLGSVSTQYPDANVAFAGGAVLSSFAFFFALGYAARYLTPVFSKPRAWKILEFVIGAVMWWIAVNLLLDG